MNRCSIMSIFFIFCSYSCSVSKDNQKLAEIAKSDQNDRISNNPNYSVNDRKRYHDIRGIILKDEIKTANDYFNAAIVLQHGDSSYDYLQSNDFAKKAVALNKNNGEAKILIAQSWDRYQRSIGQPQWYGTQRFNFRGKEYLEPIDTTKITEAERHNLGLAPLANTLGYFNKLYGKQEFSIFKYIIEDSVKSKLLDEEPVEIVSGFENLFKKVNYPPAAQKNKIIGSVLLEFTIDPKGAVKRIIVVEGLGYGCDEEALRVINSGTYINHIGEDHDMRIRIPFTLPKN